MLHWLHSFWITLISVTLCYLPFYRKRVTFLLHCYLLPEKNILVGTCCSGLQPGLRAPEWSQGTGGSYTHSYTKHREPGVSWLATSRQPAAHSLSGREGQGAWFGEWCLGSVSIMALPLGHMKKSFFWSLRAVLMLCTPGTPGTPRWGHGCLLRGEWHHPFNFI